MIKNHLQYLKRSRSQQGFTILELMIATSIFSIILLVAAAGILRFSHDYYKGVNSAQTQTVARAVIDDISRNIQLSSNQIISLTGSGTPTAMGYCIDNTLYSYVIGPQVSTAGQHALVKSTGNCSAAVPTVTISQPTQQELLGENMRLADLTIKPLSDATYSVSVTVIFGDNESLRRSDGTSPTSSDYTNLSTALCRGDRGSQFCAVSHLTTTVQQRLGV